MKQRRQTVRTKRVIAAPHRLRAANSLDYRFKQQQLRLQFVTQCQILWGQHRAARGHAVSQCSLTYGHISVDHSCVTLANPLASH